MDGGEVTTIQQRIAEMRAIYFIGLNLGVEKGLSLSGRYIWDRAEAFLKHHLPNMEGGGI